MANEESQTKPTTSLWYYVVDQDPTYPTYNSSTKYRRFLRRSNNILDIEAETEELIKVAVTVYPNDGSELTTDPFAVNDWDPGEKRWPGDETDPENYIQDWLFYDESLAKDYNGPVDLGTGIKTGGFMKLDLTYFFHTEAGTYTGEGPLNDPKQTNNKAEFKAPVIDNNLASPDDYNITWNEDTKDWICTKKASPAPGTLICPPLPLKISCYYWWNEASNLFSFYTINNRNEAVPAITGYCCTTTPIVGPFQAGTNWSWNGSKWVVSQ